MSLTQQNHIIAIGTPPSVGEDVLCLTSFGGNEELGRLFEYEVEMVSEDFNIDFTDIIGAEVTVRLQTTNGATRYFNGIVSRFSQHPSSTQYASYRATIVPWLWLLTRTSDCQIWSGSDTTRSVLDILKAVFSKRGFSDFDDSKLTGNYKPLDFCVQYRETDFNFVSRLMEREGIYYFFTHENGKHTLVLADSTDAHVVYPGYDEIHYRPPSAGTSDLEFIRDLTLSKEVNPGAFVHADFDFKKPQQDLRSDPAIIDRQHDNSQFQIFDYPGEYTDPGIGNGLAKIRMQELQARYQLTHGQGDVRGLSAGYTFQLKEVHRDDQNQKYLTVAVAHSIHCDSFESQAGGQSGGDETYHCSFTLMPTADVFRPARITPKPLVQGPQTAIVVVPSGTEIHTDDDGYGRVKVHFHWDRYSDPTTENCSCWIRVSQLWAGRKWGAMYIPRVGQEVIVEFLEGDPDQPIITGRVYNGDAMPPYDLPAKKTMSTIKSNSSIGGQGFNEFRFEDDKGNEQIFIHAEKDQDTRVKNDNREWIGNDRHLIVINNQTEKVGGNKDSNVKGDRISNIQGNHGENILGDQKVSVAGNDHLAVQGDQKIKTGGDHNLKAATNSNNECGSDLSFKAGMNIHEKSGMNHAVDAGMTVHIKGGMSVVIEAGMEISLKAGGNFIDIGPAGVAISGTLVMINSGGSAGSGPDCSPTAPDAPDSPDAPDDPDKADDSVSGDVTTASGNAGQSKPAAEMDSVTVDDMASSDDSDDSSGGAGGADGGDNSGLGGGPDFGVGF